MPLIPSISKNRSLSAAVIFGLIMCLPTLAAGKNPYGAMNLAQFIQHVGKRLDLTIAMGERVRTNKPILVYVDKELPEKQLYKTFQTVLQLQDYVAIKHKGIVRITRDREARSSPIPVIGSRSE